MAQLSEEDVLRVETGQKLGLAYQLSCECKGKAGGGEATPISAGETPYFNMEKAPVVWLEDQGSHSSHLTKAPTLHSFVKEAGGEKVARKKN